MLVDVGASGQMHKKWKQIAPYSVCLAFDADIKGSWGCLPKYYPEVLKMVLENKVQIEPFIETRPMSHIQQAFEDAHKGGLEKRIVLTPDF